MTGRRARATMAGDLPTQNRSTAQGHPAGDPVRSVRDAVPGAFVRSLASTVPWPVGLVVACLACVLAQSGAQWLSGALIVVAFTVLDRALGIPTRAWMPSLVRLMLPLSVLVAAGALVPRRARSGEWISSAVIVESAVVLGFLVVAVWSRSGYRSMPDAPVLRIPLQEGQWFVIEGEGRALNHHWRAPAQRAALDLVRVGGNGMSHRGVRAHRAGAFFAYGCPVFSPCDGEIVASRDGDDDMRTPGAHPAGNHVVIDAGGIRVVLGHFARGSVLVQTGQRVHTGQALARVGNSGNSSEPHLHIHAQRDGRPLRLRFAGRHRRHPRGTTIST